MQQTTASIRIHRRVDGVSVISTSKFFKLTETQTPPEADAEGWSTTYPTYDSSTNAFYLYIKEVTVWSSGKVDTNIYLDQSWKALNAYKYLADATFNGALSSEGGIAYSNVVGVHNLSDSEYHDKSSAERIAALRGFMSGVQGDGLAFGAHSSNAYQVAYNYVNGIGSNPPRPNFAVTDEGKVITNEMDSVNGTFTNATVTGKMKGVLDLEASYNSEESITDANLIYMPLGGSISSYLLPRGEEFLGRTIQLYNASGENKSIRNSTFSGGGSIPGLSFGDLITYNIPPYSTIFFSCFSRPPFTGREYGGEWVVVNRYNSGATGFPLHVRAMGYVSGTPTSASIMAKAYNGSGFSVSRLGFGLYKVTLTSGSFASVSSNVLVDLTGVGYVYVGNVLSTTALAKPTLVGRTTNSFTVAISDDETANDGGFQFKVYSLEDFA